MKDSRRILPFLFPEEHLSFYYIASAQILSGFFNLKELVKYMIVP